MFEKFFKTEQTEEDKEVILVGLALQMFSDGVNGPIIHNVFRALQQENSNKKFGFINNRLLNIIKDTAIVSSSAIEDIMYGGHDKTIANIESEIALIRSRLSEEEQKS